MFVMPNVRVTCAKSNDDLAKATFCSEIAKVKNARAFGVRCTGWFCITVHNFATAQRQICVYGNLLRLHHNSLLLFEKFVVTQNRIVLLHFSYAIVVWNK